MKRCLELAKKGLGTTYPNPLVGSVIVYNNKIIGEGWHLKAGHPHAEVNALKCVTDVSLLKDATIYVNLEPCNHFGKTPPCSNLIIENGIKNVIIGSTDTNPKVSGSGIKKIREAGCNVIEGVLKDQCDELNKRYFSFYNNKRPFITLKWAQTIDGFIAPLKNSRKEKEPVWITNNFSRQLVHKWRSQEQVILVGTQTVIDDNPSLTTRNWNVNSPIRVVIDKSLKISNEANVLNGKVKTIILTEKKIKNRKNIYYETIDLTENSTIQICDILYRYKIQSMIIEGGSKTLQSFIDSNLWDEAKVFTGTSTFGEGIRAPKLTGTLISEEKIKDDLLQIFKNKFL